MGFQFIISNDRTEPFDKIICRVLDKKIEYMEQSLSSLGPNFGYPISGCLSLGLTNVDHKEFERASNAFSFSLKVRFVPEVVDHKVS